MQQLHLHHHRSTINFSSKLKGNVFPKPQWPTVVVKRQAVSQTPADTAGVRSHGASMSSHGAPVYSPADAAVPTYAS